MTAMSVLEEMPTSVRERYADLLLRSVYQLGGRDHYVSFLQLEDKLGIEPEALYELTSEDLVAEVHFALRMPAALEDSLEFATELEKEQARQNFAQPHVRVRPEVSRRTLGELAPELAPEQKRRRRRWMGRSGESHRRLPRFLHARSAE
jgi:hypothetical protein